jgi:hypothetical protein
LHYRFNQAATKRFVGGSNIGSVVCTTLKGQGVCSSRGAPLTKPIVISGLITHPGESP